MAGPGETERRRRMYNFLDSAAALEPGGAQRWCKAARKMRSADGSGGMKEARQLLRTAISLIKDYATVYRTWIAMETETNNVAAARELVLDWGCVCAAEGTADEYAAFWLAYVAFELRHGGADRVRAVAVDAAKACPHDVAVGAMCASAMAEVELRLDDDDDERDSCAKKWVVDEARAYEDSVVDEHGRGARLLVAVRPPAASPRGCEWVRVDHRRRVAVTILLQK